MHPTSIHRALSAALSPVMRLVEAALVALALAMIVLVFVQVVLRYLTDFSFYGSEELSRFIFIWFIFLSAALGLDRGIHFAVDAMLGYMPQGVRRALEIASHLIVLAVLTVLMLRGFDMSVRNWRQLSSAMQVPLTFANAAVPVSCALMVLITLRNLFSPAAAKES